MKKENLQWFACYPDKLLGGLAGLPADAKLVYLVTLLRIYEVGGPVDEDAESLAIRSALPLRRVKAAIDLLISKKKLITADGLFSNPKAEIEIERGRQIRSTNSERAAKGAMAKNQKDKSIQRKDVARSAAQATVEHAPLPLQEPKRDQQTQNPATTIAGSRKSNRPRSSDDYTAEFEGLWQTYPRTRGGSKKNSFKQWNRLSDAQRATVLRVMPTWRIMCRKKDEQYIKHLEFFLSAAIFETLEQATIIAKDESTVTDPKHFSDARWTSLLNVYRMTNDWKQAWGPPPGYPGCLAPEKLLEVMRKPALDTTARASV